MTRIKICGIRERIHALAAAEAGADFIGLVFAPSKRQVTPAQAQELVSFVKEQSDTTAVVGVFVNMPASEVNRIADLCALDWVQLSGDESWEYCCQITKPLIKAIRIGSEHAEEICTHLSTRDKVLSSQKHIYLLDSRVKDKYGGTGVTFKWHQMQQVADKFPVIIAGGLTPENVGRAIKTIAPLGVDVSSGVEVRGIKHPVRIRAFIEAVRRIDDSQRKTTTG